MFSRAECDETHSRPPSSTAAFFWYGWEGALQRANLELNIKPVDIFIGNFFSRLTG